MIDEIDLVRLVAEHSGWLRLCARLEAIADRLPRLPDRDELRLLRAQVDGLVRPPHAVPDNVLDRLFELERRMPLASGLLDSVKAARSARLIDADDLVEALDEAARDNATPGATALGYMLRSFFQACRNAVAMEQLSLLALGNGRLTADARALLTERLVEPRPGG